MKKLVLLTMLSLPLSAQCVMCYRTAHSQNQARSRVLDVGIVLLGAPPTLILAGFIAYVFKRSESCGLAEEEPATTPAAGPGVRR